MERDWEETILAVLKRLSWLFVGMGLASASFMALVFLEAFTRAFLEHLGLVLSSWLGTVAFLIAFIPIIFAWAMLLCWVLEHMDKTAAVSTLITLVVLAWLSGYPRLTSVISSWPGVLLPRP